MKLKIIHRLCLVVLITTLNVTLFAQKKIIDLNTIKEWSGGVGNGAISNDAKYIFYKNNKFIIQSSDNLWKQEINNVSQAFFSNDSKKLVFIKSDDTLCILQLGTSIMDYVYGVASFKLCTSLDSELLFIKLKYPEQKLIVKDLSHEGVKSWDLVSDYWLSNNGKFVVIQKLIVKDYRPNYLLNWYNLTNGDSIKIREGSKVTQLYFDNSNSQIAFDVEEKTNSKVQNTIWYYETGLSEPVFLMDGSSLTNENVFHFGGIHSLGFSKDGKGLFIYLTEKEIPKSVTTKVAIDVWSYNDSCLQSVQLSHNDSKSQLAILNPKTRKFVKLVNSDEVVVQVKKTNIIINKDFGNWGVAEAFWNRKAQSIYSIVSIVDGTRKDLPTGISDNYRIMISPDGNWIVYYDHMHHDFFSYEVSTGTVRNLTKNLPFIWRDEYNDHPQIGFRAGSSFNIWLKDCRRVFIYDSYDIWLFDPSNESKPINLTNSYGKNHNIKFEVVDEPQYFQNISVEDSSNIFLQGFNTVSKEHGFYCIKKLKPVNPKLCSKGAFVYGFWSGYDNTKSLPIKAKDANIYMVARMSAVDAPNYFITNDFKTFQRISDVQPQKNFNWYTSELHKWVSLDGSNLRGVLYKPENFDSKKKYPVIFDYYEKRSDELNLFQAPAPSRNRINIPLFVSAGYLVFTPDINYKLGYPGESAYNSIVSAANYLSNFTWADSKHFGLQGHSFGGYETNYIVTHTNMFAAACSASGFCDLISLYGSGQRGGYPIYWSERIQGRLGGSPWEVPDLYIKNSPIYRTDKIITPLLMMNNKGDRNVPVSQGIEFFTSLRRLGKKVWMLQYDNGDHSVDHGGDAEDFHTRMMQFFDHYLKNKPAPKWMTRGIPASMKGIDDGLEYDMEIKTPGPGLLLKQK